MEVDKKYLGLIQIIDEYMGGVNIKIISKTYDDIETLKILFDLYPNYEHVLLENTEQLDSMFKIYNDMTPITSEEKLLMEKVERRVKKLMDKDLKERKNDLNELVKRLKK